MRPRSPVVRWIVAAAIGSIASSISPPLFAETPEASTSALLNGINERMQAHWSSHKVVPAPAADAATLYRRTMLDLAGRIPTRAEWEAFVADSKPLEEKHRLAVESLLTGPEFALYWGTVLDDLVQGNAAGNAEFVDWLRRRLREDASWDTLFREMMVGPWSTPETKPAQRFLEVRAKDVDRLTSDAARVFFGVDVSCARCHDHPLVDDWKQDHYYGMVSFFHRTSAGGGKVNERFEGDVAFRTTTGEQKTARVMFLSGQVLEAGEPKAKLSRRQQLVDVALGERNFLGRAFVNRVWKQLFGKGLVEPVDQLHSGNTSRVPGLLEWLGDDFAASGYDLRRLLRGLMQTPLYRLGSVADGASLESLTEFDAITGVRPLSRRQYALSLLVATGRSTFGPADPATQRAERLTGATGLARIQQWLTAEQKALAFESRLDRGNDSQSTTAEALFVSNSPEVRQLFLPEEGTLAARIAAMPDDRAALEAAIRAIHCRSPRAEELDELVSFLKQSPDRAAAMADLIWALATDAEFRFRH